MPTSDQYTINMVHFPAGDASDPKQLDEYLDTLDRESVSALDFIPAAKHAGIAAGSNTDDLTSYIESALSTGGSVYFPAGLYHCDTAVDVTAANVHLHGDGMLSSIIRWRADVNGISCTGTRFFRSEGMAYQTTEAASSRKAIVIDWDDPNDRTLIFEHNLIAGVIFTTDWWGYGIHCTNPSVTYIAHNYIVGASGSTSAQFGTRVPAGVYFAAGALAVIQTIEDNAIFYYDSAIYIRSTSTVGAEGISIEGNSLVHVNYGVNAVSDYVSSYAPPQYHVLANHVEFYLKGILLDHVTDIVVANNLLYGDGSATGATFGIHADTCSRGFIHHNTVRDASGGSNTLLAGILVDDCAAIFVGPTIADTNDYAVIFNNGTGTCHVDRHKIIQLHTDGQTFIDASSSGTNNTLRKQLIATATPSAVATSVVTDIPRDYNYLVLQFSGLSSDTATRELLLRVSTDNGSTYDSTAANYVGFSLVGTSVAAHTASSLIASGAVAAAGTFAGTVVIHNYQGSSHPQTKTRINNGTEVQNHVTYIGSTDRINALQLLWNGSGNFDAGTWSLYGIR